VYDVIQAINNSLGNNTMNLLTLITAIKAIDDTHRHMNPAYFNISMYSIIGNALNIELNMRQYNYITNNVQSKILTDLHSGNAMALSLYKLVDTVI
jgi:hypothetical protein